MQSGQAKNNSKRFLSWGGGILASLLIFGVGFFVRASREGGVSVTRIEGLETHITNLQRVSEERQKYIDEFNTLKGEIKSLLAEVKRLRDWKDMWVKEGELPLDGVQNTKIKALEESVRQLESK